MKEKLIREVQHGLLGVLDQRQQEMLKSVLLRCLDGYTLTEEIKQEDNSNNYRYLDMFVSAKRVEGCSEKTVDYYTATIKRLLDTVKKDIRDIMTDDIRTYLSEYQEQHGSSKVTMDNIRLIDFDNINNNIFKVVNQVEIQGKSELRIPDAIVYINGLPMVVIEFKSATRENSTIFNAYEQLTVRYTRDIPDLFKYNAFVVISDGVNNKYGSIFSDYDYFYAWRKIDDGIDEVDGINSLYSMVKGLFRKDRLLAVIKDFIYFPDQTNKEIKVVCRYPQFFAATKLLENIKIHQKPEGDGKGGTYFGATGCGKSYTMLFLTRMISAY